MTEKTNKEQSYRKHITENLLLFAVASSEHVQTSAQKGTQGTLVREHVNTQGKLARKHVKHVGTRARKHANHVGTWAPKARNLSDSTKTMTS